MIKSIGKYWCVEGKGYKQWYSPHKRMLQRSNGNAYYIDTHNMKTIKTFKQVLKEVIDDTRRRNLLS